MTGLQVFNTLSNKKEEFVPLTKNVIKIYACGPTVYDLSHIGHARVTIIWDVIQRYLRFRGFNVTFVRNITDIEDKIINRSNELGVKPEQLAREFTYAFWRDMHALNIALPDFEPRATEFMNPMIRFIEDLIATGHAYVSKNDVYFDVSSFKDYGKLGKKNLDQLIVGARDQVRSQEELREIKRNPIDFVLWKSRQKDVQGWTSPWGWGRPGWHIECSTMCKHLLGETIDMHGGGEDLVFPHHENEIAQSEALHGKPLAHYWVHNSFVQVNSEKMSKSLGNFSTIRDLLHSFSPDTIRLFILQTHYRNPIDFTPESLSAAKTALQRLIRAASFAQEGNSQNSPNGKSEHIALLTLEKSLSVGNTEDDEVLKRFRGEFIEAMDNDFNTAIALSLFFNLADKITATDDAGLKKKYAKALKEYANIFGLTLEDDKQQLDTSTTSKVIDLLLELRKEARTRKDYAMSDLIRNKLVQLGINVMDSSEGSSWEKV
jgi:cysteinyl-tRNA synthetase